MPYLYIMSADFKRYLISVLLPSIFTAANCSPGKCFITSFVLFKFFLDFFPCSLNTSRSLTPYTRRAFLRVEMKTKSTPKVFPKAVLPKTSWRWRLFKLCLNLFRNDYISKRLDILYIKPLFILIQSLTPFECNPLRLKDVNS